jgi:hypothetical protein
MKEKGVRQTGKISPTDTSTVSPESNAVPAKTWSILMRGMKGPYVVEARTAEELDGWLVLKDGDGSIAGKFSLKDTQGYWRQASIEPLEVQVSFVPSPKPPEDLGEQGND